MGKNNKKGNKKKGNQNKGNQNNGKPTITDAEIQKRNEKYPFVSVCTPTFNRRPFIQGMLQCFNHQTYPKDRMEWIIIDDGTDKIEELVVEHPNVKYFKYDVKMTLGRKRNLMHEKSKGDILVYMDDDDYYPPQRVSHAVEKLQENKQVLCAGSSQLYIYFKHIMKMYTFGPYGEKHGTAGTFAFKRELLNDSKYEDDASLAEEKAFLKDYTVPFVQLDPLKTILVVSHEQNTFDKRKLLENPHPQLVKESNKTVSDIIKENWLKDFYMNIDKQLEDYEPGKPDMKPDVLKQMIKIEEKRRKMAEETIAKLQSGLGITIKTGNEEKKLSMNEVVELLKQQQNTIQQLQNNQNNSGNSISTIKPISVETSDGKLVLDTNAKMIDFMNKQQQTVYSLNTKYNNLTVNHDRCKKLLQEHDISFNEIEHVTSSVSTSVSTSVSDDTIDNNTISVEVVEKESKDDVEIVMKQTNCTREIAEETLKKHNNDIVDSIMEITPK